MAAAIRVCVDSVSEVHQEIYKVSFCIISTKFCNLELIVQMDPIIQSETCKVISRV